MPRPRRTRAAAKQVEALRHEQDTRTNIPTAEYQSLVREEQEAPLRTAYQRRNRNGDPQQCAALEQWLQDVARGYGHRILPIEERVADTWGELYYIRNVPVVDGLLAARRQRPGPVRALGLRRAYRCL